MCLLIQCNCPGASFSRDISCYRILIRIVFMMKEFMDMEKLRFDNDIEIGIDIKGEAGTKTIAPLILLPFIENSFRLCNSSVEQTWINLELNIEEGLLVMKLMNGTGNTDMGSELTPDEMINVQKRLQLLYPEEHELKMYTEQEICVTLLKVNLYDYSEWNTAMPSPAINSHHSTSTYAQH